MKTELTHLDPTGRPQMVDVSDKSITFRQARAQARIRFTPDIWSALKANNFSSKKGAITDVARIAGTMAVKRTADLIPFCHTLALEKCTLEIEPLQNEPVIEVFCTVGLNGKTGVEMEALTGASVAALTLYDMTKSLGHGIVIEGLRLLSKSGGKADFSAS